jgi:mRNA interferase RelE/StbE
MALRILAKLTELEGDPLGLNTAALVSRPDRRRLRVGEYRVVCTIDNGELVQHPSCAEMAQGPDPTGPDPF